jgi:hypothetical protein
MIKGDINTSVALRLLQMKSSTLEDDRRSKRTLGDRRRRESRLVYSFRFDQTPWNTTEQIIAPIAPCNVTHFSEV